eukprot:scaffold65212_cov31-Tisochrysis_lutea.AAC.1
MLLVHPTRGHRLARRRLHPLQPLLVLGIKEVAAKPEPKVLEREARGARAIVRVVVEVEDGFAGTCASSCEDRFTKPRAHHHHVELRGQLGLRAARHL